MTEKQYCDPELFPITTQKGYSFKQQNEYDQANYDAFLMNLQNPLMSDMTRSHGSKPFREYCVKLEVPITPQLETELGFPKGALKPYDHNIMGLDSASYNREASAYAKSRTMLWLAAGLITNLIDGKLFSLSSVLLFLPGTIIAAILALGLFWLKRKKVLAVTNTKNIAVLIVFTITTLLEVAVPIVGAVLFAKAIG